MNIIDERTKEEDRKYELIKEPGEYLRGLNTYIPKLMNYLWDEPKIVCFIIQKTELKYLKKYLAPLFADNFYENILSSNYIEDNLMYMLTLLLNDEINNLTDIKQYNNFLEQTPCGILLEELRRKRDIQTFFKTIIFDSVENLEINYSSLNIDFNSAKLVKEFNRKNINKKNKDNKSQNKIKEDNSVNFSLDESQIDINRYKKKEKEEEEVFNSKYAPTLDKNSFQELLNNHKDNKKLCDFLNSKLNDLKANENLYSNQKLFNNLLCSIDNSELLLNFYQRYFNIVIHFIDKIIENIFNNFHLLPYSVKCLCRIISLLIEKKFPTINESEKNAFVAKFFFSKLLIPILNNPGIEVLINDFIISQKTFNNLKNIGNIINNLVLGNFYKSTNEESDFTPFNWYFIEKMDKLFEIFNHITKVRLPSFIEKFIKGELPEDYEYDYFKENPDEVLFHRSIFANLFQVKVILRVMDRYKTEIFTNYKSKGLEKTLEKLLSQFNSNILTSLLLADKKNKKQDSQNQKAKTKDNKSDGTEEDIKLHYLLVTSLLYNEKYKKFYDITKETENFCLEELKVITDEESKIKNNIIKVKNFFCNLLGNYNKLVETDFDEGKTENTEQILNELKKLMKSSNFVADGSIPSEWYVISLLEYLKKIPKNLTKNDCEELYNEIASDINKSIKEIDFEALSVIIGKLKFAKVGKIYYKESKRLLNDIKLNEQSKLIIENEFIPINISFFMDDDDYENSFFDITTSNFKEKDKGDKEKIRDYNKKIKAKNAKLCLTINEFIRSFPNLVKYQEYQDLDILLVQKKLRIPEKIKKYIESISEIIKVKYIEGISFIMEKIYDYIMSKIYDKLYPIEPLLEDNKIFQMCIKLSWTEPKHFIKLKRKLVYGSFLTDSIKYINLIDSEKSPRKKLLNMMELFESVKFLLRFNGEGKDMGVDDQMSILNYAFIKAQPLRIYSNAKYMELYIGNKKNKNEGNQLAQFLATCNFISSLEYSNLYEVTKDEFIRKCKI